MLLNFKEQDESLKSYRCGKGKGSERRKRSLVRETGQKSQVLILPMFLISDPGREQGIKREMIFPHQMQTAKWRAGFRL